MFYISKIKSLQQAARFCYFFADSNDFSGHNIHFNDKKKSSSPTPFSFKKQASKLVFRYFRI